MPVDVDNFNSGTDLTLTIVDLDTGALISLGGYLTEFEATANHDLMTVKPIDRKTDVKRLEYGNYSGTITVARNDGDLEDLEAQNFQDYLLTNKNHRYTVTQSVQNPGGSFNEYQYLNCLLWVESSGMYRKGSDVPLRVRIEAEQKVKVA